MSENGSNPWYDSYSSPSLCVVLLVFSLINKVLLKKNSLINKLITYFEFANSLNCKYI